MSARFFIAVALGVTTLAPSAIASADNVITEAEVRDAGDSVELRLEAREAFAEPRVMSSEGFVRIWFPAMAGASLDRDGPGHGVRYVRIRPGVDSSAVIVIRLTDMRRLPSSAIRVVRDGTVARIGLDREALGLAPLEASAEETAVEVPEDAAAEVPEEAPAEPSAAAPEAPAQAATPLALTRRSGAAGPLPSEGMSTASMLAILVLLLGGGYLALRFSKGRLFRPGRRPDIDIIAQQRIGVRHQLMVVRALGQDHLLAVHSGKTERLASIDSPVTSEASTDGDKESDALPFLQLGRPGGDDGLASQRRTSAPRRQIEDRPRFGAELMKLVAERSLTDRVAIGGPGPSDAIAGLLRLREKQGR